MKSWLSILIALVLVPSTLHGQPTEFYDCNEAFVSCNDVSADILFNPCFEVFRGHRGRLAWRPLLYVGPITIEIEAWYFSIVRAPLYIEFVNVSQHPDSLGFCDGPARVLMEARGSTVCNGVETIGPLDLTLLGLISLGETYVIRAEFVGSKEGGFRSPFLACIRVRAQSVTDVPEEVAERSWGNVKALFK